MHRVKINIHQSDYVFDGLPMYICEMSICLLQEMLLFVNEYLCYFIYAFLILEMYANYLNLGE